jgi:hypothetical protein
VLKKEQNLNKNEAKIMLDKFKKIMSKGDDAIKQGKDMALSLAIEKALKFILSKYGEVKSFKIDTTSKTITSTIHLKGENEVSDVTIEGYSFVFQDEGCGVQFEKLTTNKEWFNQLASDYLIGKTLPIKNPTACSGLKVFFG